MIEEILMMAEDAMQNTVEAFKNDISKIRTGRASANMLSTVMVDFYGTPTPVAQTSQISVPEPQQIVVKPYDKSQLGAVVAGINKANLGLNPMSEADLIRINIPTLTEEIRRDLVKKLNSELEQFKIRIRNERRDANDKAKKSGATEDQIKGSEADVQTLTDKYIGILEGLTKEKEKELMTI